ncbi:LigA [Nitrospirillum viridazoti Y2]|nr:LigA [Nitrospirillum amazonense Y2]
MVDQGLERRLGISSAEIAGLAGIGQQGAAAGHGSLARQGRQQRVRRRTGGPARGERNGDGPQPVAQMVLVGNGHRLGGEARLAQADLRAAAGHGRRRLLGAFLALMRPGAVAGAAGGADRYQGDAGLGDEVGGDA